MNYTMLMVVDQKSERLTHSLTAKPNSSRLTSLWLRCSSHTSPLKLRCPVISVTEEEFKTLVLRVDHSFVDVISSACKHRVIIGEEQQYILSSNNKSGDLWIETCILLGA